MELPSRIVEEGNFLFLVFNYEGKEVRIRAAEIHNGYYSLGYRTQLIINDEVVNHVMTDGSPTHNVIHFCTPDPIHIIETIVVFDTAA